LPSGNQVPTVGNPAAPIVSPTASALSACEEGSPCGPESSSQPRGGHASGRGAVSAQKVGDRCPKHVSANADGAYRSPRALERGEQQLGGERKRQSSWRPRMLLREEGRNCTRVVCLTYLSQNKRVADGLDRFSQSKNEEEARVPKRRVHTHREKPQEKPARTISKIGLIGIPREPIGNTVTFLDFPDLFIY
jgi:hypothetical protein